ncbi:MAG: hypothetical protein COW67_10100 [Flavobacteriales bacterium CG18_big_fil_WC_8_21_14_2_50_32_9]|nr:DUF2752 domain-containing protein [Flavobacteriales bacterium]NCQ12347.1 DUF2752 domain-containing protein [Bacteroidota bacterium]PIQ15124.1 MAG: hypothetical protein COW67_10100 [Flavobacteriales bacterium CG18_big_fil_WC_8_21_14_2_50_32_9]PIZ05503.1 MAG: hypothetical protein COY57_06940 [Flavobacteriales bacterium CG_4_10_14_0_8_um_filter_32_5]PJC61435.1 MAG: hypothetical protein CO022_09880 [Flavobacteriales bacterium CG_4_9_14_0_2_um_filter_32_27]
MRLIHWLEQHLLDCPYKKYLGMDCMGCGMQRAFIALLKGNLVESFLLYPPLITLILMFILLPLHLIFKFKHGAAWLKYLFIFNLSVVVINFIVKLL